MTIERESIEAVATGSGFVHVHHVQRTSSGVDMGGDLWFEWANREWVARTLTACLNTHAFERVESQQGGDLFKVFEGGHEQAPFVHLINRRLEGSTHAGVYAMNMTRPIASELVDKLGQL